MAYDITVEHPSYCAYKPAWTLMRDAFDGEERIKEAGETYLPMKSGTAALNDSAARSRAYDAYRLRAEFPELVSPTVRGAVGLMLKKPAVVELPKAMNDLIKRATLDGLSLEGLHRRVATELMVTGRYGLLPGMTEQGDPHIAGYIAESIINWDAGYLVLDETGNIRNLETGKWEKEKRYRECMLHDGGYVSREWVKGSSAGEFVVGETIVSTTRQGVSLGILPFVFIDTNDLTAEPDDVPLYGLGRLAVRIYRLDADYTFALHMTSEPTPVAIGFDDPKNAVANGNAPKTLGSSTLWILPPGGDAKFLEFSGPGLAAQKEAIADALNRAVALGAQVLTDARRTAESGDAIKLRLGHQASTLTSIALTSAAGLEAALRNIAIWIGQDPNAVTVQPNLEFFDEPLNAQELAALVAGWQAGAYSYPSMFERLKRGQIVPQQRTIEEEQSLIAADDVDRVEPGPEEELPA